MKPRLSTVSVVLVVLVSAIGFAVITKRPAVGHPTPAGSKAITAEPADVDDLKKSKLALEQDLANTRRLLSLALNKEAPAASAAVACSPPPVIPPVEEPKTQPESLRRPSLDTRVDAEPSDPIWQAAVTQATQGVLERRPGSELLSSKCSKAVCRLEFMPGPSANGLSSLMDELQNIPQIEGERLIQIDDSTDPPYAVAYFGRDGAVSLLDPSGERDTPEAK